MSAVHIRDLWKSFAGRPVLRGLDLDVPAGQVVSIIGPSGSGKSTLLRILMTLERPDGGRVEVAGESLFSMRRGDGEVPADDRHLRRVRRHLGMVFQQFNLFPHLTVLENVIEAPVHVRKVARGEAVAQGRALLQRVGLEGREGEYPARLSGGQQQRVAIARALAMQPRVMLFDEITSALDPELVDGMLALLRDLAGAGDTTMLIVTHEMAFARDGSDRVLFIDGGVVVEDAPPDVMFTAPTQVRTREFLRSVLGSPRPASDA